MFTQQSQVSSIRSMHQISMSASMTIHSQNEERANQKAWTKFSDLMDESERLKTFVDWNVPFISKYDLAAAGFFHSKDRDMVQCVYCDGRIGDWERNDIPMEEHKRHFPKCPVVVGEDVPENQPRAQLIQLQVSHHLEDNGPKHMKFVAVEDRLRSFSQWPSSIPQRPENLAAAGFYYTGISDHVRCFCCDGGLRNWQAGDDCWREHARYYGKCSFLLTTKGQAFVDQVLRS